MTGVEIGIYSIIAILVLIQLGMHVAIALMAVSFFGVYLVKGKMVVAGALLSQAALDGVEPHGFEELDDDLLHDLAGEVRATLQRHRTELAAASEESLRFVPRLVRPAVRRIVGL